MTSSALALGDVLAANGEGFEAPGLGEFYPEVIANFTVLGVDFEITRITLILWIATLALVVFLYLASRNAKIVPGKLQFVGETGYSLVRDGIARDVVGPRGLPFAPFLASLFFFILANNLMAIIPFAQISPMSKFAFPLMLAVSAGCSTSTSASGSRASASTSRTSCSCPACPSRCTSW